jgi:hypothetical protein
MLRRRDACATKTKELCVTGERTTYMEWVIIAVVVILVMTFLRGGGC